MPVADQAGTAKQDAERVRKDVESLPPGSRAYDAEWTLARFGGRSSFDKMWRLRSVRCCTAFELEDGRTVRYAACR